MGGIYPHIIYTAKSVALSHVVIVREYLKMGAMACWCRPIIPLIQEANAGGGQV